MPKQADDAANKPWMIRDMPVETRREVKIFAARTGMTIAEALDFLVKAALYMVVRDSDFPVLAKGGEEKMRYFMRPLQLSNQEEYAIMLEAVTKIMHRETAGTLEEQLERSRADSEADRELRGRLWREGVLKTEYDSADANDTEDTE